ncbi:MAG: trypsin-like peptidase domain-containing protein [Candidatus Portnoybacteria bacterium]|nr:trypsin-like peptidase domain-containing protein [Candidatus Portnoybacteria bacterium]
MENKNIKNNFSHPAVIVTVLLLVFVGGYFLLAKKSDNAEVISENTTNTQQSEIDALKKQIEDIKNTKPAAPQTITKDQSDKLQVSATFIAERTAMLHCLQIEGTENEIRALYDVPVYEPAIEGSSVIISAKGEILTNAHVVGDTPLCLVQTAKAPNYSVPSPSYYARVLAVDKKLDIAKLQTISDIEGNPVTQNLKYFEIAKQTPSAGQKIYVAGFSAASNKRLSITEGIISGYDDTSGYIQGTFLITSAKIDSGNSGGAAFTNEGKLIGLPTFIMGNYEILGYILDLNRAKAYFSF